MLITEKGLANTGSELLVKFSTQFLEKKKGLERNGYTLVMLKVNFILYWKPEDEDNEVKVVLPELNFEKIKA